MNVEHRLRLLLLARYGRLGASSRLRHYQFLPHLAAAGFDVEVASFFDDSYLEALYTGRGRGRASVLEAYARRLSRLLRPRRADLVWIEKELLPWVPSFVEAAALGRVAPYVVDYDDAWFHHYDRHPSPWLRRLCGDKIDRVMARAKLVTVGNAYLKARAERAGARWIEVLPSVVDLTRYAPRDFRGEGGFVIGWIGTPLNAAQYLPAVAPALGRFAATSGARVVLVGAGDAAIPGLDAERPSWSEAEEASEIARFDVGIMPLADGAWERGKCGYKLIQYMAAGKPVIASPVGGNRDIVEHGVNGFLVEREAEWEAALTRLHDDPALAARMGAAGRETVRQRYSLVLAAPRLAALLRRAAVA